MINTTRIEMKAVTPVIAGVDGQRGGKIVHGVKTDQVQRRLRIIS